MEAEHPNSDMKVGECIENAQGGDDSNLGETATNNVPDVNSVTSEVGKLSEHVNNMHKVPPIYREDVVRKNSGMIGVVTEVAGESDSDSDLTDEDTDDDDDDDDEDGEADEDNDGENVNDEEGACDGNENSEQNADKDKTEPDRKNIPLAADQVRVLWLNNDESTESLPELTVIDRGFLHGDYVAAASDPIGQVGVVVDVSLSVDLLSPDGLKKENVSTKELKRVRDLTVGDYVVLGPWLGRIDDVTDNVTVSFDDGSACKVMRADPLRLRPITKSLLDDGHFPYYPGQRVRASSSSVFKSSRWLSGVWKASRMEGTVTKVSVGSVFIYWIASAGYGPNCSTAPAEEQSPKNLKLLSSFAHANWQLGDWCLFPSSGATSSISLGKGLSKLGIHDSNSLAQTGGPYESEDMLEESQGNDESMDVDVKAIINEDKEKNESNSSNGCAKSLSVPKEPVHRKKIRKVVVKRDKKPRKKEETFEHALLIANIKTRVDVSWQDGTIECGVDSTSLIPIESPGDHDFVPEQYVVEKASDDSADTREVARVGVIKSINAKERTACVKWLKPVSRAEDPREFNKEEIVSVYELEGHPDYDYCYGDVVVRLTPVSLSADSTSHEKDNNEAKHKKQLESEKEDQLGYEADLESPDLSWVGNITGLRNGDIEVTWADGMVSTVGPQAIYVVGRDDDDDSVDGGSAVSDDAASWETVEDDDEMGAIENDKEEGKLQNASDRNSESEDGVETSSGRNAALSLPLAAIGYVTRLASGIFLRARKDVESNDADSSCENELQSREENNISEDRDLGEESSVQESNTVDNCDIQNGKKEEVLKAEVPEFLNTPDTLCNTETITLDFQTSMEHYRYDFKRFDIVGEPVDHHFLGTAGQSNGRKWLKKVQQDWTILQNNLPDGIFVRVYEDRMDLLRAVIVGAYGTPYQDGLFFFDFHLPPEYPDGPPLAHYHSGGWRINPNLYEEGKVCLSLLNTWTGRGNEVWDPLSSSILQVLVSLQGLVLNFKPYFNEAGYDKQIGTAEGEKNSISYNENTFLLNCKTMMYLIRKPPKDFGELVKEHFKKRGYYILKACDAYMKGYLIGSLAKDASVCDESSANSTSVGFKLMLAKIVPKLYLALNEVGASCHDFKHLQES